MKKYIAYYWSSTSIEADGNFGFRLQQETVKSFLRGKGELIAEYSGVGGGQGNRRPELDAAIAHAQVTGGTLIVDRLNRVSREADFVAGLRRAGLDIVAVQSDRFDTFFTA